MAQENDSEMNASFSTLNVNAMEFVPSFCTAPTTINNTDEETITTPTVATPMEVISDKTPENVESDPLDSWDVEEEPISTPDDDELGDLEDVEDGESGAIKIAKKKLPKVEESKSKKEHVNVVFIGHVGRQSVLVEP